MSATALFNSYVGASAISAAVHVGLLDEIAEDLKVELTDFAGNAGLDVDVLRAVADVLIDHDVLVALDETVVAKGAEFDDVHRHQGYFLWLVRGYGEMLSQVGELARPELREPASRMRDGRAIATAGRDYGGKFVDRIVFALIDELHFEVLADLGCGSANRIIELARRYPAKRFIGVEVDAGAVDVARQAVRAAGLTDRVRIIQDDIRELRADPRYTQVDAVISFFLGHDLWPRENCLATLAAIRDRLPNARNFLLSDTFRSHRREPAPIFTQGFELTHAVMRQQIPTEYEWVDLVADSVWRLRGRTPLDIAFSDIFHLVPRDNDKDAR